MTCYERKLFSHHLIEFYTFISTFSQFTTMMQSIRDIEFIQGVDLDLIDNLPADGTKYFLIIDDSLDILSKSEKFNGIATAVRRQI